MHLPHGYEDLKLRRPVVTMGIFDGVHLGHRYLLDLLVKRARAEQGDSVVITFSPHPRMVLDRENMSLTFLNTLEEKTALLEQAGIDHLLIIEFTREFSMIPACDFVSDILIGRIGSKHLIVGYNHHFGRKGEGDFDTVRKCAEGKDLIVERVEGVTKEGGSVSSSVVREVLLNGRVDEAAGLLGYSYPLSGTVAEGKRLGRTIGFPTANIIPSDTHKLIPGNGVYAVEVLVKGNEYKGMLSIGSNPTVNSDQSLRSIEVHLLAFAGDLYNSPITVRFRKKLRDEIKFSNLEELKSQLEHDMEETMKVLS
jgi:riboflavin kinase/FMN adenylyltransferase